MFVQTSTATVTANNGKQFEYAEGFEFTLVNRSESVEVEIHSAKAFAECPSIAAIKEFPVACGKGADIAAFAAEWGVALDAEAIEDFIVAVQDGCACAFDMASIVAKPAAESNDATGYPVELDGTVEMYDSAEERADRIGQLVAQGCEYVHSAEEMPWERIDGRLCAGVAVLKSGE